MTVQIHPTAIIEDAVTLGDGTAVWDNAHIRCGATLGDECIVGGKSYIAYNVQIGNRVKINAFVYICHGVTLEDGVMLSAAVVFTNDRFPRATTPDLATLRSSAPDEATLATIVREGATIGARATIGPGITIGRFAMIGMGSVVTQSVADFHLVVGNPARSIGCVCRCGVVVDRFGENRTGTDEAIPCPACGLAYRIVGKTVAEYFPNR